MFHTVVFPHSPLPLIGASGAISGVLGFYFVWFPHNQVRLLVLIVPFFMRVVSVSARLVLGFFLLIVQGLSELIKRFAFLRGLIPDPTEKHEGPTAEEQLAEEIRKQRGEAA